MPTTWNLPFLLMLWRGMAFTGFHNARGCQQYLHLFEQTAFHHINCPAQPRYHATAKRLLHGLPASATTQYTTLEEPSVIYSDNHLLVVNKPPGWHSVPNPTKSDKCLLTKLKDMGLGGGSNQDFLLSMHRIDQPCSGLLLFGKTSKAATRITTLWKEKKVQKYYLVAVPSAHFDALVRNSVPCKGASKGYDWFTLQGILENREEGGVKQRSVRIRPMTESRSQKSQKERNVSVNWKAVDIPKTKQSKTNPHTMLLVQTTDGARHVVRAILAQVGKCPIQGDLRYGGNRETLRVLPDQSVALHAFRIHLDEKLKLGSLSTFEFEAPFPASWESFFGFAPTNKI